LILLMLTRCDRWTRQNTSGSSRACKSFRSGGFSSTTRWISIDDLGQIFGQPVAISTRRGIIYDHHAASEVYESNGGRYVNLVHDAQWWAWAKLPPADRPAQISRAVPWATRHVWVQQREGSAEA